MGLERTTLEITGADRVKFLQDLVTNDVAELGEALTYAALLSPQGKYLYDFFLFERGPSVYLDIASEAADGLIKRLQMYRLRADVSIGVTDLRMSRGLEAPPQRAMPDPRHSSLGWRSYGINTYSQPDIDWPALRVAAMVPETGAELVSGESYILEMGFERLGGVDFKKGCYVGQEVTARMKHKTELKKGLARLILSGPVSTGADVLSGERKAGTIHTVAGARALAFMRFDRVGEDMTADGVSVKVDGNAT